MEYFNSNCCRGINLVISQIEGKFLAVRLQEDTVGPLFEQRPQIPLVRLQLLVLESTHNDLRSAAR